MKRRNQTFIILFLLITVFTIVSCGQKGNVPDDEILSAKLANQARTLSYEVSEWDHSSKSNEFDLSEENLFGTFYRDRVAFYIIPSPDLKVNGTQVSKLTLYYIDDVLYKKKYELETNIASELMNEHGSFKFKPLNSRTKKLSRSQGIVLHSSDSKEVNSFLDHYQMKWGFEDKTIVYLHHNDSLTETNYYIEELLSYQKLLKAIPKE